MKKLSVLFLLPALCAPALAADYPGPPCPPGYVYSHDGTSMYCSVLEKNSAKPEAQKDAQAEVQLKIYEEEKK